MSDPTASKPITLKGAPPSDPTQPINVALAADGCRDPALSGLTTEQLLEYIFTRDEGLLNLWLKSPLGEGPTWFTLAPLGLRFSSRILSAEPNLTVRRLLAVRACLTSVKGPGAIPLEIKREDWCDHSMLTQECLEKLGQLHGEDALQELGDIIIVRAKLRPGTRAPFGLGRA